MESNRQSQKHGDERGDQKWRHEDSQLSETCSIIGNYSSLLVWIHELVKMPYFTDFVRKAVREELERGLIARRIDNQIGISETKPLQLMFKGELPGTIFTNSKIKAEDDTCVEIALYDTKSQSIVAEGPLSSMKIEICVLNGEFGSNGNEDWSRDEFDANIESQRDNKGKLLKGDTVITLTKGVGYIPNLVITDNSSWRRTRRFRLGAKVVRSNLKDSINIREGISKPFIVKDTRGEKNKKRDTPSLNDELWRLIHISRNGKIHQQLSSNGINIVEDLLKELETNSLALQEKFGKISKRKREEIIKHAKKAKHAKICVAEATFDVQNYHSENNSLNFDHKESHKNLKDLVPFKTITHDSVKTSTPAIQYGIPAQDLQHPGFPIAQEEEISRLIDELKGSAGMPFVD